jgi:hypothetical protein
VAQRHESVLDCLRNSFQQFSKIFEVCNETLRLSNDPVFKDLTLWGVEFCSADMVSKGHLRKTGGQNITPFHTQCSAEYSALACFRTGWSTSASFHNANFWIALSSAVPRAIVVGIVGNYKTRGDNSWQDFPEVFIPYSVQEFGWRTFMASSSTDATYSWRRSAKK